MFLVLLLTLGTNTSIIIVYIFQLETFVFHLRYLHVFGWSRKIKNLVALLAEDVSMQRNICIVAGIFLINGQHLCGAMLDKQLQRIIHSCFRKGRNVIAQSQINFVNRGMRAMRQQIVHDSHSLYRRLNVET